MQTQDIPKLDIPDFLLTDPRFDRSGGPDACWPWTRRLNTYGYGRRGERQYPRAAHRWVYQSVYGPIPKGLVIRHLCHRRECVNPLHLRLGTQAENVADTMRDGRGRVTGGARYKFTQAPLPRPSLEERFWTKVNKDGGPESCWIWTSAKAPSGYGAFSIPGGKVVRAHRLAYELLVGPIPSGLFLLHACDNPSCCNPAHLRPGTQKANMEEASKRGRSSFGERNHLHRHPENSPARKLNAEQVTEIRRRSDEGEQRAVLAREFGVSATAVFYIAIRRNWAHLH